MKRTLGMLTGMLMVIGTLLTVGATAVYADSAGACGDSSTAHYISGNEKTTASNIERVQADIQMNTSTSFKPCTPDDNAGFNGPSALIGLSRFLPYPYTAHVQAGIVRCVNVTNASWCDGTPHLFSEWKDGLTGATVVRDLGAATYGRVYTVLLDVQTDSIDVFFDGYKKTNWYTGSQMNVSDDLDAQWLVENHDRGDGLGGTADATDIGNMQYRVKNGTNDYTWWLRASTCTRTTPEIGCHPNGTNSLYFTTSN